MPMHVNLTALGTMRERSSVASAWKCLAADNLDR
jgi:hypothetical protein